MENWERRYLHEKAKRDAYYAATGREIPRGEAYGTLTPYVIGKWTTDFWIHFVGHDHMIYDKCSCNKASESKEER